MNLRLKLLLATDRVQSVAVVALVFGSAVCFGGAIWWFRPAAAVLVVILVGAKLTQLLLIGRVPVFQSPLFLLWLMALLVAFVQLVPLPPFLRACSRRPHTRFTHMAICRRWPGPTCLRSSSINRW